MWFIIKYARIDLYIDTALPELTGMIFEKYILHLIHDF